MIRIHIISESAAVGNRLRDILFQAGYTESTVSGLSAATSERLNGILIIYAKSRIADIMQIAAACEAQVILLLNPDRYARYLDRARHIGIKLLLMPVAPDTLLDAVATFSEQTAQNRCAF